MKKIIFYFLTGAVICFFVNERLGASCCENTGSLLPCQPDSTQRPLTPQPRGGGYLGPAERVLFEDYRRHGIDRSLERVRSLLSWTEGGRDGFIAQARCRFGMLEKYAGPLFEDYNRYHRAMQAQARPVASLPSTPAAPLQSATVAAQAATDLSQTLAAQQPNAATEGADLRRVTSQSSLFSSQASSQGGRLPGSRSSSSAELSSTSTGSSGGGGGSSLLGWLYQMVGGYTPRPAALGGGALVEVAEADVTSAVKPLPPRKSDDGISVVHEGEEVCLLGDRGGALTSDTLRHRTGIPKADA